MKDCIIVDIHKTLMHRNGAVNNFVLDRIKVQVSLGVSIVLVSRDHSEQDKSELTDWLKKHKIPYDDLFVSPPDMVNDKQVKVKEYILEQKIKGKYNPVLAIDDKKSVRKMYEERGIKAINPDNLL